MSHLNSSTRGPLLCYVTDRRSFPEFEMRKAQEALSAKIEAAATSGVDWIQIREKDLSGRNCALLVQEALQRAAKSPGINGTRTRILVNDRLDVALSERAGGVHLGEKSLPPSEAKQLANAVLSGQNFLIGASCHSLEAARSAASNGADYLFFGPVFTTPSKAAFGAPQGLELLAEVCQAVAIPVLAIGGITVEHAADCFAAGASGIAAIRLFQDARDIFSLIQSLRRQAL